MDRRTICEFLVKNEVGEGDLMKFRDEGESGCVAIAHNGMKFRISNAEIDLAEAKLKPKPKPRRKPATKPASKKSATKKPATKKPPSKK